MNRTKKKKIFVGIFGAVFLVLLLAAGVKIMFFSGTVEKFRLEDDSYGDGRTVEVSAEEFEALVSEKQSFLLMAHMAYCPAEMPLTDTTELFVKDKKIRIYVISADEFKKSSLVGKIKYLPTMAVFHKGELVDFLDAESDEDLPYYQSVGGLESWVEQHVDLK